MAKSAVGMAELEALGTHVSRGYVKERALSSLRGKDGSVRARAFVRLELLRGQKKLFDGPEGGRVLPRVPGCHGMVIRTRQQQYFWVPDVIPQRMMTSFKDQYTLQITQRGLLGEGSFGTVKVGLSLDADEGSFQFAAVKQTLTAPDEMWRYKLNRTEWDLWMKIPPCRQVIGRIGSARLEDKTYLVGELAGHGDLRHLFATLHAEKSGDRRLHERLKHKLACEILRAVSALHALGYCHRDIKPANMVLGSDGNIKLIDLGSCTKAGMEKTVNGKRFGSIPYLQPSHPDNTALSGDIYSTGVMLLELATGSMVRKEFAGYDKALVDAADTSSLSGCAKKMMAADPAARPAAWPAVAEFAYFHHPMMMDDDEFRHQIRELLGKHPPVAGK